MTSIEPATASVADVPAAGGTTNALLGIAVDAVVIFVSGFPLAHYAARHNIDRDLITRKLGISATYLQGHGHPRW